VSYDILQSMKKITIFTDGASRGNPGKGGWGSIIRSGDYVKELGGSEKDTTNNRMELMAVIAALEYVERGDDEITIHSDSKYVIQGATSWIKGWKDRGWKTSQKTDVLNKDLWERLDIAMKEKNITWKNVAGHVGIAGNERADVIATKFADKEDANLYEGLYEKYDVDLESIAKDSEATVKKKRSKMKAYSYMSLVDGVFNRHKTWDECKEAVSGKANAKFRKSISEDDEKEILKEWGV